MEEIIKNESEKKSVSFIEQKVINDLAEGKNGGRMQTRFPPEPNDRDVPMLTSRAQKSLPSRREPPQVLVPTVLSAIVLLRKTSSSLSS